jgi:hypothetical protein
MNVFFWQILLKKAATAIFRAVSIQDDVPKPAR